MVTFPKVSQNQSLISLQKFEMFTHILHGPVAQPVEHLTFNQGVAGSNPAGLTTFLTESVEKPSQTFEILSPKSSD